VYKVLTAFKYNGKFYDVGSRIPLKNKVLIESFKKNGYIA